MIKRIVQMIFDRIPIRVWNSVVNGQVFNILEEDDRSPNIIISGVKPAIICIIKIQNDRRSIIKAIEFENYIFDFIVKRIICLLYHYGLDYLVIRCPNFNVWV